MNLYYIGSALGLSTLYMMAGIGNITALKCGEFNLGGEGQIYAGGFICAIILDAMGKLNSPLPVYIALPAAFLASAIISAFLCLISSLLKNYKNVEPLFTTFILSSAIIPLIDGMIAERFRTAQGNLLSTAFILPTYRIKSILPPSTCNFLLPVTIGLCIAVWFIFDRTSFGRKVEITGISSEFAKYSGYDVKGLRNAALGISGAFHGLCGAAAVCGTYFTCHSGFYSGIGWNALSAALIATSNPILLVPSSIVLSFIITYSNKYALFHNLGFDVSGLIQGIILLIIAFLINRKMTFGDINKGSLK